MGQFHREKYRDHENLEDRIMNDSDGKKGKLLSDALTNHTKDNLYWGEKGRCSSPRNNLHFTRGGQNRCSHVIECPLKKDITTDIHWLQSSKWSIPTIDLKIWAWASNDGIGD